MKITQKHLPPRHLRGFTLTEMAIVMVIVGLLLGAVLTGKSLIRSAEIQSVMSDKSRYITVIKQFKEKYGQLPGDLYNATKYWGALDPDPAACRTQPADGIKTCNGDGDGRVNQFWIPEMREDLRLWQHLAASGMIEGKYTGKGRYSGAGAPDPFFEPGVNTPKSSMQGAGFRIYYLGTYAGSIDAGNFNAVYGNTLQFTSAQVGHPPLTPQEAYAIDAKIDDGKPGRGTVLTFKNPPCLILPVVAAPDTIEEKAEYNLALDENRCELLFVTGF